MIRPIGVIFIATLASRFIGLGRDVAFAWRYGASAEADAYLLALLVPTVYIASTLASLISSTIPVLIQVRHEEGDRSVHRTIAAMSNWLFLGVGAVCAGLIVWMPDVISLMAPGFHEDTIRLTTNLATLMIGISAFSVLSALHAGVLQMYGRFTYSALAPLPGNMVVLVGILLSPYIGGIRGVAALTLAGAVIQFLAQLPELRRVGYRHMWTWDMGSATRRVLKLGASMSVNQIANQATTWIDRALGSTLPVGRIAALNYANKLYNLPLGLISGPFLTVLFPHLGQVQARGGDLGSELRRAIRVIIFVMAFVTAVTIALARPITALLFQRGAFSAEATLLTASALASYALGIIPSSVGDLLYRAYMAIQASRQIAFIGILGFFVNVGLDLVLVRVLGHTGLALGLTLTNLCLAGTMLALLQRGYRIWDIKLTALATKSLAAAGTAGGSAYFICKYADEPMVALMVGGVVSMVVYLGVATILRVEELHTVYDIVRQQLTKGLRRICREKR